MNEYIKEIINNIDINNNKLLKINNNLYLTQNQIEILKKFNINYEICNSLRDLMLKIEDILDYDYDDELDNLLNTLAERNYYENTNK